MWSDFALIGRAHAVVARWALLALILAACALGKPAPEPGAAGPLRVHPGNPRYFTDDGGKAVYLTGSHTWDNLRPAPLFDFPDYLEFLRRMNHNFVRLWAWEHQDGMAPYARTGPGSALDGGPKYDLTRLDEAYVGRLRARVAAARDRGIFVAVMLFQGWSVESKGLDRDPWRHHPMHRENNVNGIDGDADGDGQGVEVHTLALRAVTAVQEAYVRKVVETLNDLPNVLYEIGNELHAGPAGTAWQEHMVAVIRRHEAARPWRHPVLMSYPWPPAEDNTMLFRGPAEAVSPGWGRLWGSPGDDYVSDPPAADGGRVVIVDTDHFGWEPFRTAAAQRAWVWKSLTRGLNPIFMDPYRQPIPNRNRPDPSGLDPRWDPIRRSMGYTRSYALRLNLAAMVPRQDLCSTAYCLANPAPHGGEYLVYLPAGGTVTVDASVSPGPLRVEWFSPATGEVVLAGPVEGGQVLSLTAPFPGEAVLYLDGAGPSRAPLKGEQR